MFMYICNYILTIRLKLDNLFYSVSYDSIITFLKFLIKVLEELMVLIENGSN